MIYIDAWINVKLLHGFSVQLPAHHHNSNIGQRLELGGVLEQLKEFQT